MRLLHIQDDASFRLVEQTEPKKHSYAILSHTWGQDKDEVSFQDLFNNSGREKPGYQKLVFCARQAIKDKIRYCWVDTCCIDKSSSQELSEAIASMFKWYRKSTKCYVYLSDVSTSKRKADHERFRHTWEPAFRSSKWFTRGWTLQELLAPPVVKFFSKEGEDLGNKEDLKSLLHEITGIPVDALEGAPVDQFSFLERMRWMKNRFTKREEDMAYSLWGIFDVSMATIYGEGRGAALRRLQKEVQDKYGARILPLDDKQKHVLLDSLRYEQIDSRHLTIKNARNDSCQWILATDTWQNWLDLERLEQHQGFLWIKGKPGTGKSTLMKYLLSHTRRSMPRTVFVAFFFNARGDQLEKSTVGTYRSLLLQLLEQLPSLQEIFETAVLSSKSITVHYPWNDESLQSLLEQAIRSLGRTRVICFIDALDECEEQQIRNMISFFERIGQLTTLHNIHFQVCFSSRHYPEITLKQGLTLVLEGQEGHSRDVTDYLESELKIGNSQAANNVRDELQQKAGGVFMWVVLVVSILNKEYDRGRMFALKRRLQETPTDLHELFRDILTRDARNKEELIICIQWVLYSRYPLRPEQLYFAILSGVDVEAITECDSGDLTADSVRRFLLDSSKGLVEITRSKQDPRVQFIHESVRDFLLREGGLSDVWPELRQDFEGRSHDRLKQCCVDFAALNIEFSSLVRSTRAPSQVRGQDISEANRLVGFLEYVVPNVLYHADAAESKGVDQRLFIESLPWRHWITLHKLIRHDDTRIHQSDASGLYLLAEGGFGNLIRLHSSARACFAVGNELYGTPFLAAIATGSKDVVHAFVDALQPERGSQGGVETIWELYSSGPDGKRLSPAYLTLNAADRVDLVPLLLGTHNAHLIDLTLTTDQFDFNSINRTGDTPLTWAVKHGELKIVESLLRSDFVDPNQRESHQGRTPLLLAVALGQEAIVEILLDHGKVDKHAIDPEGHTTLSLVADGRYCNTNMVKLLLKKGEVNINSKTQKGMTLLMMRAMRGDEEAIKFLVGCEGINVNEVDKEGTAALMHAVRRGWWSLVSIMMGIKGLDVNVRDRDGRTLLIVAARRGNIDLVKRLLTSRKLNQAATDHDGLTALMHAASCGHAAIVELLRPRYS